ncbi:MAG: amidoligase family protein [Polyangiaceae bacterium]|nr:amidoligase family protein [Myxococcales bacterium]MCB9589409.1 amidoligase family protein [Polyangiaceae bacterium]
MTSPKSLSQSQYLSPPRRLNPQGNERRLGLEFEFVGVSLEQAADVVRDVFGGEARRETEFHWVVDSPELGEFSVECDAKFLKEKQYEDAASRLGLELSEEEKSRFAELVLEYSDRVVPNEIVTPPLPLQRIGMADELNRRFAKAMEGSPLSVAPCGLHINVEVASFETAWILAVMRAYAQSYERIVSDSEVSLLRRVFPYIKPYPALYVAQLEDPEYKPDQWTLIEDYARLVGTRNMGLDVLPLFGYLSGDQLERHDHLEHELIKPRPAFHYRLPNCRLGDPDWSVAQEWNRWVSIERIAEAAELQRRRLAS